jgi:hypothetical protein
MASSFTNNEGDKPVLIRRGRVEYVDLYEVKDTELELFEKGSPADLQLNFAVFLLSIAFSAIVALVTATFAYPTVHTTFVVVAVVGVLMGIYLMIAWWRNRTPIRRLCKVIRQRIKETTSIAVINKGLLQTDAGHVPDQEPNASATEPGSEPKG